MPRAVSGKDQRVSGRRVVLVFWLIVFTLAGGAIALWFYGREPMGPIRTMTPVDDRRVLLMRGGHRQHRFIHLTHRDLARGQLWSVPFRDLPAGAVPVVAANRAVSWVRNDNGRLEIHAFGLETGAFAFRAAPTYVPPVTNVSVAMVAVGDRVVAAASVAETKLYVIDARTGQVTHTIELDASPAPPRLRVVPDGVEVVPSDGVPRVLDLSTGTLTVVPPGFRAPEAPSPVTLHNGVARYAAGARAFAVRAMDGQTNVPIAGARMLGGSLWLFADDSVASVDVSAGRVRTSHGHLSFTVAP
jgi:hypothetical protein